MLLQYASRPYMYSDPCFLGFWQGTERSCQPAQAGIPRWKYFILFYFTVSDFRLFNVHNFSRFSVLKSLVAFKPRRHWETLHPSDSEAFGATDVAALS